MPLTDLRPTLCRLGSHSVDFVSLRSPWHHLVSSASGVQALKEYLFLSLERDSLLPVSCTKHVWYSEHGTYYRFEFILERAMSATHIAVILRMRTSPAYEEEFMKMDYPDARNEYGTL